MDLREIAVELQRRLDDKMRAREIALSSSRRAVRDSANAIRATHRGDVDEAHALQERARAGLDEAEAAVVSHPDVRWAGFVHDAQKEFAEALLTEAVVSGKDLPTADELRVTPQAYLNGIAEAVGEGRRAILDLLRQGETERSEEILASMEEMYHVLVSMDYPDAITANLRRATDAARGILERTRGDLSMSLVQRDLRDALERHARDLGGRSE